MIKSMQKDTESRQNYLTIFLYIVIFTLLTLIYFSWLQAGIKIVIYSNGQFGTSTIRFSAGTSTPSERGFRFKERSVVK